MPFNVFPAVHCRNPTTVPTLSILIVGDVSGTNITTAAGVEVSLTSSSATKAVFSGSDTVGAGGNSILSHFDPRRLGVCRDRSGGITDVTVTVTIGGNSDHVDTRIGYGDPP